MPIDHDKLHPWPAELPDGPLGTMRHLLHLARHPDEIDPKREFHFAWHLAGVGGASFDPHPQGVREIVSAVDRVTALQDWCNTQERIDQGAVFAAGATAIPWQIVLPIIIDVIRWLLDRWQTPPKP